MNFQCLIVFILKQFYICMNKCWKLNTMVISRRTRDTHTCCRAFSSGAVTFFDERLRICLAWNLNIQLSACEASALRLVRDLFINLGNKNALSWDDILYWVFKCSFRFFNCFEFWFIVWLLGGWWQNIVWWTWLFGTSVELFCESRIDLFSIL